MPPRSSSTQVMWPVVVVFALIMLLLTLAFDHLIERRRQPNVALLDAAAGTGRAVIKRNHYGSYLAPGRINGQPVSLLIDTGASLVALPESVADRLGLERGQAFRVTTASGTTQAFQTWIDSIVIGGIEVNHVRAAITPAMPGEEVLLGMSFLRHVEFVQRNDELLIEARANASP